MHYAVKAQWWLRWHLKDAPNSFSRLDSNSLCRKDKHKLKQWHALHELTWVNLPKQLLSPRAEQLALRGWTGMPHYATVMMRKSWQSSPAFSFKTTCFASLYRLNRHRRNGWGITSAVSASCCADNVHCVQKESLCLLECAAWQHKCCWATDTRPFGGSIWLHAYFPRRCIWVQLRDGQLAGGVFLDKPELLTLLMRRLVTLWTPFVPLLLLPLQHCPTWYRTLDID